MRLALAACLGLAPALGAQVVRGRVTERESGLAQAGVLVELLAITANEEGARVAAALTGPDGAYALRAPSPYRYVVTAKRIGVRRTRTAPFDLGAGETVVRDLQVEALLTALPTVSVVGLASCTPGDDAGRMASLWEEARTALDATQLSLRDQLFRASVTRYVRELDPRTRRAINETRSSVAGVVSRPFSAVSGDSLSRAGYWHQRADGGMTYFGPDADVLLSDAFLRDHCFGEVKPTRAERGMVGLGFRPVASRTLPDVVGTLWLDERTYELHHVDFHYSRVQPGVDSAATGGEVHFARLGSGAWIVRKWFIRLPVVARPNAPVGTEVTQAPWVLVRPTTLHLREEGGEVAAEELVRRSEHVTMRGQVRDSSNRPLADATVRIAGTRLVAVTGATGTFTIDSLPFGTHLVMVEVPGYDSLGIAAADLQVEAGPGKAPGPVIRLLNGRQAYARACLGRSPERGRGALRVAVRSAGGDSIVQRLPVTISWRYAEWWTRGNDSSFKVVEVTTDDRGLATLCDLPAERELTVVMTRPVGGVEPAVKVTAPDRGVRGVVLRLSP